MGRNRQNRLREAIPIPPPAPLPDPETIDVASVFNEYVSGAIDLVVVLGPTASGKTRYAVELARKFSALTTAGVEIISADSRQVYRGMDIGTGKDLEEYGDVPYHLIDIVPAGTRFDLYQWQQAFEEAYRDIRSRGSIPVLCGGTGLYIQAATSGYSLPQVPPDEGLRAELEQFDIEELREKLAELGPLPDEGVMQSKRRVIRALEVALYKRDHPVKDSSFMPKKPYCIGTLVSREERNARIDARLDARLQGGLIEEVKGLLDSGIRPEDLMYYGLEYKFVTQHVLGILSYDEMRLLLGNAIHQFAKRQMTWFRGMEKDGFKIHWTNV
ncbi:MAG: tRNA (adenosine(37)-N6)-dimethylallyltransferase MiaA [Bacteroidales bacterium]|nr:tRNA (adenosine(37)-N6)-dimethylallyltransferase MiaA [Bacteroidales bacterium]MBR4166615.1 tRNA (adenosine(37)-N6)-dimethylallyltransferase MiaA [Bacteroidales bacterium]